LQFGDFFLHLFHYFKTPAGLWPLKVDFIWPESHRPR